MKRRLYMIGIVFILFTGCLTTFSMAENPCRQRLFKICQEDESAGICKLLSYNKPETVESVSVFLTKIAHLDSDVQEDLICARLMGRKKILNIRTVLESPDSDGQYQFRSGIGRFSFKIDGADYPKLIDAHGKLAKLKLCPKKNISFDIQGMVVDADAEYSGSSLKSFVLKLENVRFSNITTIYAKGGFNAQRKPLEKKIREEYDRYLTAGTSKKKQPRKKVKTFTNSIGMEFVRVPVGSFSSLFECEGFYVSRYEVTQKQWKAVMGNNPSYFKNCGDDCPVESISWNDVQKFIRKMNQMGEGTYRLPSEAEWEYAARAGSNTAYCFGDDKSELYQYAWHDKNSGYSTHPVGQLKPNDWGLYDMHGNVVEWCEYLYDGSYRVLRGGGWYRSAGYCRSAFRNRNSPGYRHYISGFRLVCLPGQK